MYRLVFSRLNPAAVEQCFMVRARDIKRDVNREITAVDGKTVRGTFSSKRETPALPLASARAASSRLVPARVKTKDKSSGITAVPPLLELIALEGCIAAIDAADFSPKAAGTKLPGKRPVICLPLKKIRKRSIRMPLNTFPALISTVRSLMSWLKTPSMQTAAASNGVCTLFKAMPPKLENHQILRRSSRPQEELLNTLQPNVSSLPADPKLFAAAALSLSHWGIENSLRYVLGVVSREDACRIKNGSVPENFACFHKIALTAARSDEQSADSVRACSHLELIPK